MDNEEKERKDEFLPEDIEFDEILEDDEVIKKRQKLQRKIKEVKDAINDNYLNPYPKKQQIIEIDCGPCPDNWTENEHREYEKEVKENQIKLGSRQQAMREFKVKIAETVIDMVKNVIDNEYEMGGDAVYIYNKIRSVINQIGKINLNNGHNF